MKQKIIAISIFLLVIFSACRKKIPFEGEYKKSKLVVNTLLYKDSLVKVDLTASQIIIDDVEISNIYGAKVSLYRNGVFLENLKEQGDTYISTHVIEHGVNYKLKVSADGYESVECEAEVPQTIPILNVDTITIVDENGSKSLQFTIEFPLQANKDEFFWLKAKATKIKNEEGTFDYSDNNYYDFPLCVSSEDIIIESEYDRSLLFSDKLITGDSYSLKGKVYLDFAHSTIVQFYLVSINEETYHYFTSLSKHLDSQDNFLMESVIVYSNVSSGMGIMGGGACSRKSFLIKSHNGNYYE